MASVLHRFMAAIAIPAVITAAPPARCDHFLTFGLRISPDALDAVSAYSVSVPAATKVNVAARIAHCTI